MSVWAVWRWGSCWGVNREQAKQVRRRVRGRESAGGSCSALSGQGEECHFFVHGRSSESSRTVRLQAAVGAFRWNTAAEGADQGLPCRLYQSQLKTVGAQVQVSDAMGNPGTELSELLPHLARVVDDIAIVKSMVTDAFNHAPAQILMNTGSSQFGRPSFGSWVTYGLGSETEDLPGFIVFSSGSKGPSGGNSNWGSGFLPTVYQGVQFRSSGDPVLYLIESSWAWIDRFKQASLRYAAAA